MILAHKRFRGFAAGFLAVVMVFGFRLQAAEPAPKKEFFLPKNPVAAAYVLARLSNQELIDAPRGEFVYVALLERNGLDRKYRVEAMENLAKLRKTDGAAELIKSLSNLDQKGEDALPALRDLATLLLQAKPETLAANLQPLAELASQAQIPLVRQAAFAAQATADGKLERVWTQAESDPKQQTDLLLASELVRNPAVRAEFYAKAEPLAKSAGSPEVQRAAMAALGSSPGREAEAFGILSALARAGTERGAAVSGLARIPKKLWPKDQAEPLLQSLMEALPKVSESERAEPDFATTLQFASDLASLMPPEKAAPLQKTLRGLGGSSFLIRTILEQMLYDKIRIVVEAGKPVEITLQNEDSMPHNLVVVAPGSVEEIGNASEKMTPEPNAAGLQYVPASPKILHATKLVDPGQKFKLAFTAPAEPGDYPYVCTYPGHWRRMLGTMVVVPDVEAYLAAHSDNPEPKVTEWKLEDFAADLPKAATGRNLAKGKELFTNLACAQCHKLGAEGNNFGPELTDVFKRYNNDRATVLKQILDPSAVIADRYRNYVFEMKDGESMNGMILKEDTDTWTVQTGPSDALIQPVKKSAVAKKEAQASSLMPMGLLNLNSKEDIFDLLAFLSAGGKIEPHNHNH